MSEMQNSKFAVPILTAWTTTPGYDPAEEFGITPEEAAEYDRRMRVLAINIVSEQMPWLFQALADSGARAVGVAPGNFHVVMLDGQLRRIPDLEAHLNLTPWCEPGEACH